MTRRPRILHVCEPQFAGAAKVAYELARELPAHGFAAAVLTPRGPLEEWCRSANVEVSRLPLERRRPGYALAAARIVRAVEPRFDIVHLHSGVSGVVGRLWPAPRRRPIVYQPHAWSFLAVDGPARTGVVALERVLARRTDLLICVSEHERDLAQRAGIRASRTAVIRNGVAFTGPPAPRVASDPGRPAVAGTVTRLNPQKSVDVLIRAVADPLWPAGVQLEIVGDGALRAELARLAATLGVAERITFLGYREEIASDLARWDLFVASAAYEAGVPLTVLEAMAAGLPVVSTAVADLATVLGDGALVTPVGDSTALAGAVAEALADPAATHARARCGWEIGRRELSLEAQVEATAAAYRDLLADR